MVIRAGASADLGALLSERHPEKRVVVISDANVAALVATPLPTVTHLIFAAGEHQKTRDNWAALSDQLLAAQFGRDTVLVAFGGGVTTDLVGFVAATYLRGVPWIAMPTTTLAMVDAAIGGKTGVDTPAGKNLIGAIHHPDAVLVDTDLLATLPERHFREGLAEAVKHAAILDARHGHWLLTHAAAIGAHDATTMTALVTRSIALKAAVVSADEFEHGQRAILNAGHTVAHALERASSYAIPHGEAVAMGLVLETRCAERMGVCASGTADEIVSLLDALGLPSLIPADINPEVLVAAMGSDKKNREGIVHAALLREFGSIARDGNSWTRPLDLNVLPSLVRP